MILEQVKPKTVKLKLLFYVHSIKRMTKKTCWTWIVDNISEWCGMSICKLLFQWVDNVKFSSTCRSSTKKAGIMPLSSSRQKRNMFSPWYSWKCSLGVLKHSLTHILGYCNHVTWELHVWEKVNLRHVKYILYIHFIYDRQIY